MGIILEPNILNRSMVETSDMWNRTCDTWSELFVASAMSIKDTMNIPMVKDILCIVTPAGFRNVMKYTGSVLVAAIDRIFICNDLFAVTSLNGDPSESICAKLFSEHDAKKVLREYFRDNGSEEIFTELHYHNRIALLVHILNLSECYLHYTVLDMMPMDNTDPEHVLVTIENPVFYSVLLMALSANHLLIQCDKYPEDPISLCPSIREMRLLLKTFVDSVYFIPSVFECLISDDRVNKALAYI